jgi:hypothetical protein
MVAELPHTAHGASDEALLPLVLRELRGLCGFHVVLLLIHLRLQDKEGAVGAPMLLSCWFGDVDAIAAAPPNDGRCRVLRLFLHLALQHAVWRGAV